MNILTRIVKSINYRILSPIDRFLNCACYRIAGEETLKNQWKTYDYVKKCIIGQSKGLPNLMPQSLQSQHIINGNEQIAWIYWNTGMDSAPAIVKKCQRSVQNNLPDGYRLIILTEKNISDYVTIPQDILEKRSKGIIKEAHFSDLLRSILLYLYGGLWFDATCYVSAPIPEYVLECPFFMFKTDLLYDINRSCLKSSSWFIKADKGSYILEQVINMLLFYWQKNQHLRDYYLYHICISALVDCDPIAKKSWDEVPYICNMNPHVMLYSFDKPYSPNRWEICINSCFIHKLTYKFKNTLLQQSTENILQHFMQL